MSLNKDQKLSDNRRSDSFDDRICDDLSEVIVQYLPIEDKFRFECVSKQFQRTVFQRQYELKIQEFPVEKKMTIKAFEVMFLLKKLPQINYFRYSMFGCQIGRFSPPIEDSVIGVILKNCNNLVKIELNLSLMSETTQQLLTEKFGSKLVSINTSNSETIQMIDNSFPNIKELKVMSRLEYSPLFSLPVRNLRKMTIYWTFNRENIDSLLFGFKELIENNKCLTHLTLVWNEFDVKYVDYKHLLQLNQLISFKLISTLPIKFMTTFLEQLSQKCLQIKCLSVNIKDASNETDVKQLMEVLKKFNRLKRLYIGFDDCMENIDSIVNNSFETGFKGLTHLRLCFESNEISFEKLIKNLPKHSPDLRYLDIGCEPIIASNEVVVTLGQFSRLECLEIYWIRDQSIADSIEAEVIKNCRKIKTINITVIPEEYYSDLDEELSSDGDSNDNN